jgi:hypothetical protein
MEKFTKRNVFAAIVNYVENGEFAYTDAEGAKVEVPAEALATFAKHEIELLDNAAVKAKERKAKKAAEPDALTDAVVAALTDNFATIADIAAKIEDPEATIAKVTYRLNALVEAGNAEKTDVKIPGGEGKRARTVKAYKIA